LGFAMLPGMTSCGRTDVAPKSLPATAGDPDIRSRQQPLTSDNDSSLALFEKCILPIFQSARPSSCSECHLSGVDLKNYIRPSQQETFVSLVEAGMIDVKRPDESKILNFIDRQPEKSALATDKMRTEEYEAFSTWIHAAVEVRDCWLLRMKRCQSVPKTLMMSFVTRDEIVCWPRSSTISGLKADGAPLAIRPIVIRSKSRNTESRYRGFS